MGHIDARLAELGITLPAVATPVAAYVPAMTSGNLLFTAGQLPFVDGALLATGKVGAEVSASKAAELARVCALNALAAANSVLGSLDKVTRVIKVNGFGATCPVLFGCRCRDRAELPEDRANRSKPRRRNLSRC